MKAIFFALGSRGDIEPLFSLGEFLREKNWDVLYVFPEQFREMVHSENARFHGFTKEFIEVLLASENSKIITSRKGSVFSRMKTLFSLAKKSIKINKQVTLKQQELIDQEQPDIVFFNQKCIYPIIWGMQHPNKSIFIHPFPCFLHSVNDHSIIGFSGGGNYGKTFNRFTYFLQSHILSIATYFSTKNILKAKHKSYRSNPFKIRKALLQKIRSIYTVSPSLFQPPDNWKNNAQVVGFVERDKSKNWNPDQKLLDFLNQFQNKKIFLITFGSISNTNPEAKTKAILNVLQKHKIPCIINTSWGGLLELEGTASHILFVKNIPYDWIFPKVYGVIHHGGAGTTHSAIKYACASLIIPHFIDQFFWSKTIVNLELGPKGPSIKKLKESNFEKALLQLVNTKQYKENADAISDKMKTEFSIDHLLKGLI